MSSFWLQDAIWISAVSRVKLSSGYVVKVMSDVIAVVIIIARCVRHGATRFLARGPVTLARCSRRCSL
jgi:hypothetical protein